MNQNSVCIYCSFPRATGCLLVFGR